VRHQASAVTYRAAPASGVSLGQAFPPHRQWAGILFKTQRYVDYLTIAFALTPVIRLFTCR